MYIITLTDAIHDMGVYWSVVSGSVVGDQRNKSAMVVIRHS